MMLVTIDASALKPGLVELFGEDLAKVTPLTPRVRAVGNAVSVALSLSVGTGSPATVDLDLDALGEEELDAVCRRWRALAEAFSSSLFPAASELAATLYVAADRVRLARSVAELT